MAQRGNEGKFDELCQQYKTWIIEYNSGSFASPLYMVWLTDSSDDDMDKLILSEENKIIAATTPTLLLDAIKELTILPDRIKTTQWLHSIPHEELNAFTVYDINRIQAALDSKQFTHTALEEASSFINLFGDLAEQLGSNELWELSHKDSLGYLWNFFYDWIFWPRYKDQEEFEKMKIPEFEPDYEILTSDFNLLVDEFERRINIAL